MTKAQKRSPDAAKAKVRGLGRVFQRSDADTWMIEYWVRGKQRRESSHSRDRGVAVALLKKRLGEAATGRLLASGAERIAFEDLAQMVLGDYALKRRKSAPPLARLREHFADYRAVDIGPDDGRRYVAARRAQGAADATIRNEIAVLARALRLAHEAGRLPAPPRLPLPRVSNARQGFFTDAEVSALLGHLPEYLRPFVEAAYITGWRRGELRSLTWAQVDWEAGTIRLERGTTKSGEPRSFPFAAYPRLAVLLREQRERTSEFERSSGALCPWVFHRGGHPVAWYYAAWHTACVDAGVPGRLFHDLRRSAVRNLIRAGVSEGVAMSLTGHKTRAIFDRYHIVSGADQIEAVRKLAARHDERAPQGMVLPLGSAALQARRARSK